MTSEQSTFAYFRERWKPIIGAIGAVLLLVMLPLAAITDFGNDAYRLDAAWPSRLSNDTELLLPITLTGAKPDADLTGEVTVYFGSSQDRRAYPDAIADGSLKEIARGRTDSSGRAIITLPAVQPLADNETPVLVAHVDAAGEDRWSSRTLELVDAPVLALTLDRPLYQPGQVILLRGLVASATSGKPLDTKATFKVRDARGNLVLDETIETGPDGVAATQLELADRCVQGTYSVEMLAKGATKTSSVEVAPYQLPRFTVAVRPQDTPAIPGDEIAATVVATYTYGEPVEGADASVTAKVGDILLPATQGKTDADGSFFATFEIPRNVGAGASIDINATVTSTTGRTLAGAAKLAVAGRKVQVKLVPAGDVNFRRSASQRGYALVSDQNGPIANATVSLTLPEEKSERTVNVVTDAKGRAEFDWHPSSDSNGYASVEVVANDSVIFKSNIQIYLGEGGLQLSKSVLDVGESVDVETSGHDGILVLIRDGVTLAAKPIDGPKTTLTMPSTAAGFATLGLMSGSSLQQMTPMWIRQQGGDTVGIELAAQDVRPGSETEVSLSFPAPKESGVTFGLVGVDEALYALKERAQVPLYVLMRRAPTSIFKALAAFDDVDPSDRADIEIATHTFRRTAGSPSTPYLGGDSLDAVFERDGRRWFMRLLGWLAMLGLFGTVVQLLRITRQSTTKTAFTLRHVGQLAGAVIFCGLFAGALASGSAESLVGGMAVWSAVVACWLVAAAIRLPDLRLDAWLLLHVLALGLSACVGICASDLSSGRAAEAVVLQAGIAIPLVFLALQWLVWVFILLREKQLHAGLGAGSFVGIAAFGTLGATFFTMGTRYDSAPMMKSAQYAMMAEEAAPEPAMPSPSGGAAAPSNPESPRVRSWFPETMIWLPEIASDSEGRASVRFEVPDSITTWRLNAWANTTDGRFGEGQTQLRAIQPYFVELDLPFEVTDGDRFEVPVTLVNRGEQAVEVDLNVESQGPITVRGVRNRPTTLAAGERATAWLDVAADGVGEATVTVTSTTNGEEGDAVRRSIRVAPDGRILRNSASAIVGEGWEHRVMMPPDAIEGTRVGEIRVFGSVVADALSGLDSMLREPNGCFEQTSSANYPNVMVLRAMRDMKPEDWADGPEEFAKARDRADKFVRLGYQRIISFQHSSGGFVLYPDQTTPSPMLTAYGILQLVWASDVTTVDREVITRAARWLVSQQNGDGSWPRSNIGGGSGNSKDIGHARSTAFAVMALAAVNDPEFRQATDKALVRLEDRLDSVESPNALAFVTAALMDAGSKQLALKAAAQLAAAAKRDGETAYWESDDQTWMGGYGNVASVETTALGTYALFKSESQPELLQPALTWLSRRRGHYGGFGSTQATVWTLRTLEALRAKSSADATLRFYFDSTQLQTAQGADELRVTANPQPLRQFDFTPQSSEGRFVIDASASTTAMVQLVTEVAVDWDSRFANIDGEPFGGEVEVERTNTRGATIRAYARIENSAETPATSVIIEAPIPPGAFVPKEALDELLTRGAIDHYEVLPTHVRFYVSEVPGRAERVFAYDFIPLIRGSFSLPPLRAYPFYSPEPRMEVDSGDVRTR